MTAHPLTYRVVQGARTGAEASLALLNTDHELPATVIGIRWNQIVAIPLESSVAQVCGVWISESIGIAQVGGELRLWSQDDINMTLNHCLFDLSSIVKI